MTHKVIAQTLGISTSTITKILRLYRQKGNKGIALRKRGRPEDKSITKEQERKVKDWIIDRTPDQLKLPFALWTREAVMLLIKDKFDVKVSRWTSGRYLREWGFTPQKPVYKAYEQKSEEVKQWLKEAYPEIQKRAKQEKAVIFWGDETGMRSDHQAGRSYAPKGHTPVIRRTGNRFKINMISAINNCGLLKFMIINTFNSKVFIRFLGRMIERAEEKIYVIVDGHPAHKTVALKQWLEKYKEAIELFYLPAYSPELNPDEYLNQDIKTNVIGKQRPKNKNEMTHNVKSFLRNKQMNPQNIMAYFREEHVRYAA